MQTVTLSTKYQLVIPRDVRQRLDLEPGAKLTVVEKGGILYLVPERPIEEMRGIARPLSDARHDARLPLPLWRFVRTQGSARTIHE